LLTTSDGRTITTSEGKGSARARRQRRRAEVCADIAPQTAITAVALGLAAIALFSRPVGAAIDAAFLGGSHDVVVSWDP
jgi:hypothetical protein